MNLNACSNDCFCSNHSKKKSPTKKTPTGGYPEIAQNYATDDMIHCRLRKLNYKQLILMPPCVTVHQNHARVNRVRANTRWILTEENLKDKCADPFQALPTDGAAMGVGDWGYPDVEFEELVV